MPSSQTILDLVRRNGVVAQTKFEARMAAAALQLVERAAELQPASDSAELVRLRALLQAEGDVSALNRQLCVLIRNGELALNSPGVAEHVRATTMEKLAIDQPTYAAYRRALEDTKG